MPLIAPEGIDIRLARIIHSLPRGARSLSFKATNPSLQTHRIYHETECAYRVSIIQPDFLILNAPANRTTQNEQRISMVDQDYNNAEIKTLDNLKHAKIEDRFYT